MKFGNENNTIVSFKRILKIQTSFSFCNVFLNFKYTSAETTLKNIFGTWKKIKFNIHKFF